MEKFGFVSTELFNHKNLMGLYSLHMEDHNASVKEVNRLARERIWNSKSKCDKSDYMDIPDEPPTTKVSIEETVEVPASTGATNSNTSNDGNDHRAVKINVNGAIKPKKISTTRFSSAHSVLEAFIRGVHVMRRCINDESFNRVYTSKRTVGSDASAFKYIVEDDEILKQVVSPPQNLDPNDEDASVA